MRLKMITALIAMAMCVVTVPIRAQSSSSDLRAGTTAEVRLGIPDGGASAVSLKPGQDTIELELPRGASVPDDFEEASGGLLRGGEVTSLEDGRLHVVLYLARGLLEEFRVEPGGVVLRLHSRSLSAFENGDHDRQYLIGADDRILVTVHNHPELSATLVVSRGGTITMPHLGEIVAEGLTDRQLGDRIADLLAKNIVVDPRVDIQIHEFNSQWAMVSGEVRAAGKVPLKGGTDLKTVLAEAGGMTSEAGERIVISRRGPDGAGQPITVDRVGFEHGEQNPVLQHGDIVTIVRAAYCYVQGEVKRPGEIRIDRGMTLQKALALAGGLTDWAKRKEVKIIYPDGDSAGVVYNLADIENGKVEDPWLVGGEIVIVKRRFF